MNNLNLRTDVVIKANHIDNFTTDHEKAFKRIAIEDHHLDIELGLATGYEKDENLNVEIFQMLKKLNITTKE